MSRIVPFQAEFHIRMTSGCDEIEHGVDTIVAEAGVTLDA